MSFGWVFMILLWGPVILSIIALTRWLSGRSTRKTSAQEILQERYTRGEIDQQEYQEKMRNSRAV
jgi:putative membrane protein